MKHSKSSILGLIKLGKQYLGVIYAYFNANLEKTWILVNLVKYSVASKIL